MSYSIPCPGKVDVRIITKEGSTYYGLVVAAPLQKDARSQRRLLKKIEDYISDRHSEESLRQFGQPTAKNTKLTAAIHPGSDTAIFELLERCRPWLDESRFAFEVTTDAKFFTLR